MVLNVILALAVAADDGAPKAATTLRHGGNARVVLFSPAGDALITAGSDGRPKVINGQSHNGKVTVWRLPKGTEEPAPPPFRHRVYGAALTPDGRRLALSTGGRLLGPAGRPTIAEPGELVLFDTAGKKPTVRLDAEAKLLAAATSPQDRRGRELKPGGLVALWDVEKARRLPALKGHAGYVWAVTFSPDGKLLASAAGLVRQAGTGEVKLWDVATGKEKAALDGHVGQALCVAFSPDGRVLASGGADRLVRLWDVATGKAIASLTGHGAPVAALAFSPDGKLLASGAGDQSRDRTPGELKLWDVAGRKEKASLGGHARPVVSVAFDRAGARLASASTDGVVQVWELGGAKKP
jgi:WD40 repeat protein